MNGIQNNKHSISIWNLNDGDFLVDTVSLELLRSAYGKSKRDRKTFRKRFFARGYDCDKQVVWDFLKNEIDIKINRTHSRILANFPISGMSRKQFVRYKTEVYLERCLAIVYRSQLKFRLI